MITLREAVRLVQSFLCDAPAPQLSDQFHFDVYHECGWGCRGKFIHSLYNSSRAKCVRCCHCSALFSPNKFIFHCHKTAESQYTHPDAANFNSWRRHLKLSDRDLPEEIEYAWEDIKALFNGGSRKRLKRGASDDWSASDDSPSAFDDATVAVAEAAPRSCRSSDRSDGGGGARTHASTAAPAAAAVGPPFNDNPSGALCFSERSQVNAGATPRELHRPSLYLSQFWLPPWTYPPQPAYQMYARLKRAGELAADRAHASGNAVPGCAAGDSWRAIPVLAAYDLTNGTQKTRIVRPWLDVQEEQGI